MEGPNLRSFPRTSLTCPIELRVGDKTVRFEQAVGNLSVHGLFLHDEKLPANTAVHVKLATVPPFEVDGVVRFCNIEGVGIEFVVPNEVNRRRLDELIADFTTKETLAS